MDPKKETYNLENNTIFQARYGNFNSEQVEEAPPATTGNWDLKFHKPKNSFYLGVI